MGFHPCQKGRLSVDRSKFSGQLSCNCRNKICALLFVVLVDDLANFVDFCLDVDSNVAVPMWVYQLLW